MTVTLVLPHSQSATVTDSTWLEIDAELSAMLSPIHSLLSSDSISPAEAGESFASTVHFQLTRHGLISEPSTTTGSKAPGPHRERGLVILTKRLSNLKNRIRSENGVSRQFLTAVRTPNRVLRTSRQSSLSVRTRRREKTLKANPWLFAKSVCDSHSTKVSPLFSSDVALHHFSSSFSWDNDTYVSFPDWVQEVISLDNVDEDFDMSPIVPKLIKCTLQKCSLSSSPGCDGITYHHLRKLPSTHHFLATLYSKLLFESQHPPPSWCVGKLSLIYKSGSANDPSNFRPIALTSVVGKLFHKILAHCLESYLLSNDLINPSAQKGFLSGVNGTFEHIYAINAIPDNAKVNHLPVSITFIDLKNAFGSVSHKLIHDILQHIKVLAEIRYYI